MNKEEKFKSIINGYSRKSKPPFTIQEYALIEYENFCLDIIQENKQLKEENKMLRNIKIYKQDDDLLICVGEDCKRFKINTNELLWIKESSDSNE